MKNQELQTMGTSVYFRPEIWTVIRQIAEVFIKSGALSADVANAAQLTMKLQAGYELGMQPIESMNSLYIVGGRVTMWGEAVLRRLRKFGYKVKYIESNDLICKVKVTAPDGEEFIDEATYADAEKSGWTKDRNGKIKFNYKCPKNKLRYNAIRTLIKFNCPEVLGEMELKESAEDYVEAEIVVDEVKKEHKKEIPKEVKGEQPKEEEEEKKPIKKDEKEATTIEENIIGEIHEIVGAILLKQEKEATTKNIEIFINGGLDKLFSANRLTELTEKDLNHYINILKRVLKKDEK